MEDKEEFISLKEKDISPTIPKEYICPLSHDIFLDPVIADDGYTYEKTEVIKVQISPMTRQPLSGQLFPNLALKSIIRDFLEKYPELKEEQYKIVEEKKIQYQSDDQEPEILRAPAITQEDRNNICSISAMTGVNSEAAKEVYLRCCKAYHSTINVINNNINQIMNRLYFDRIDAINYYNKDYDAIRLLDDVNNIDIIVSTTGIDFKNARDKYLLFDKYVNAAINNIIAEMNLIRKLKLSDGAKNYMIV